MGKWVFGYLTRIALKIFFSAISKLFYVQDMCEDPLKWFILTRIVFDRIQNGRQNG